MSAIETARRARDAALAGERVAVTVPPSPESPDDLGLIADDWPKVLGSFAGVISLRSPSIPVQSLTEEEVIERGKNYIDIDDFRAVFYPLVNGMRLVVRGVLAKAIKSRNLADVADFSNQGELLSWAISQPAAVPADAIETTPAEKTPEVLTRNSTAAGIGTFSEKSMGVAGLLTELFSSDVRIPNDSIREQLLENGYKLLVPMMSSRKRLFELGSRVGPYNLADRRNTALSVADSLFHYEVEDGTVTNLHWRQRMQKRGDHAGCPFALAEKGKLIKPAWGSRSKHHVGSTFSTSRRKSCKGPRENP
ncbi:hypothetical protein A3G67_01460 [Candidatus Roizmanbacteria bacterium RIFCSPLOWO2_12_FULL_40_12]|nr:MAG: hypothetical protein A3G67_01460 [Candidatus Roizmanbacteria bacterium RIFCSPLOWO2_12_FULL_40_12]